MRVLLDTNILVSTIIKPQGKPAQIFSEAARRYDLLCSEYLLDELVKVLVRPHIQKKYPDQVTANRQQQFIEHVRSIAFMVKTHTRLNVVADSADNQVLAGAIDGGADFLVTGDPHLKTLGHYQGCRIVSPDQFLAILDKLASE